MCSKKNYMVVTAIPPAWTLTDDCLTWGRVGAEQKKLKKKKNGFLLKNNSITGSLRISLYTWIKLVIQTTIL